MKVRKLIVKKTGWSIKANTQHWFQSKYELVDGETYLITAGGSAQVIKKADAIQRCKAEGRVSTAADHVPIEELVKCEDWEEYRLKQNPKDLTVEGMLYRWVGYSRARPTLIQLKPIEAYRKIDGVVYFNVTYVDYEAEPRRLDEFEHMIPSVTARDIIGPKYWFAKDILEYHTKHSTPQRILTAKDNPKLMKPDVGEHTCQPPNCVPCGPATQPGPEERTQGSDGRPDEQRGTGPAEQQPEDDRITTQITIGPDATIEKPRTPRSLEADGRLVHGILNETLKHKQDELRRAQALESYVFKLERELEVAKQELANLRAVLKDLNVQMVKLNLIE